MDAIDKLHNLIVSMKGTAYREDLNYAMMLLREIREAANEWKKQIEENKCLLMKLEKK